ncbi:MAG TPA: N-acetylmuramoyl-L-alanine amidase [Roseiflexaceae bacterium]|nr:N-acetylmuramoyl-L-alanine amidase [Roseiflexaceae bacterium]
MPTNDPTTGMPPMIGRRLTIPEWLSYIGAYQFGSTAPSRVVLHHTVSPTAEQWAGLRSMQGMQRYYAGKGWTAAPHVYVAPDGVWLFTPLKDIGIHAGTGNSGYTNGRFWYSIGVEMVGNYDRARPSGAIWEGVKAVLGGLSKRLGITPRQLISFHRDYTNLKSCCGWAVTKDWVFGEVDAWLGNRPPPAPPPPGPIGQPSPEAEALAELLLDQSYSRRGEGYNGDWAFHQYATQNKLGFPIGKSALLQIAGTSFAYQPFARDTLYNQVPNWGDVRRMSDLLAGGVPASGLGRALLDATFRAGGAAFHPDWAFHQYVLANRLGPPIGESANITVDRVQYSYQVFALDTLFNRVPNWTAVRRLGELASATDPATLRLRDALLAQTYARAGATYHPDWAFHQLARGWNLGAPLSDSYRAASSTAQYAIQVYATDTLYNVVPNWSNVRRLSQDITLGAARTAILSIDRPVEALLSAVARPEAMGGRFVVAQYAPPGMQGAVFSSRDGSRIALIVLHGDPGPARASLARMAALGAQRSTHYYLAADGAIYQLVDDADAAWHSGMADWNGRNQNINRISLGVTLERGPNGYSSAQLDALAWLVRTLRQRYDLPATAVLRWSDLDPSQADTLAGFPWKQRRDQ